MPIRLLPSGVYEFDTVNEAVEFSKLSSGGRQSDATNGHSKVRRPFASDAPAKGVVASNGKADFAKFLEKLDPHQKDLLAAISPSTEITTQQLATKLSKDVGQIGPTIRHIRTKAEKYGLDPDKLVVVTTKQLEPGERPMKVYTMDSEYAAKVL